MTVQVSIPLRLRVDRHALDQQLDELGDAVLGAASRALVNSVDVVLGPRGDYLRTVVAAPTFAWTGPDAAAIPGAVRRRVESLVAEALTRAAETAGVAGWGQSAGEAPEVIPSQPSETFDAARYDRGAGLYEVPSYGKRAKKREQLKLDRGRKKGTPTPTRRVTQFTPFAGYDDAFRDALYAACWEKFGTFELSLFPSTFAVLYLMHGYTGFVLHVYTVVNGRLKSLALLPFGSFKIEAKDSERPHLPPTRELSFEWESGPGVEEAGYRNMRQSIIEQVVDRRLKALQKQEGSIIAREDPRVGGIEVEAKKRADEIMAGFDKSVKDYWMLKAGSRMVFRLALNNVALADTLKAFRALRVVSLTGTVEAQIDEQDVDALQSAESLSPSAAGEGAGGAAGKGDGGDGLDGGFGPNAGAILSDNYSDNPFAGFYPGSLLGTQRITTECKAWQGEPSIDSLPGGSSLRALIQEIANRLEIPTCPYAVNFAINAGRVIGERAEQVTNFGLSHEEGFMKPLAQVAADRRGHYYFEPVDSVALQYLKHLAGTIPLLRKLLAEIDAVLGPRQDQERWRFSMKVLADVAPPAVASVQKLFVYACQICLVQLLNASKKNIEQRVSNIDNYVKTFCVLVDAQISELAELTLLRNALQRFEGLVGAGTFAGAHDEARRKLLVVDSVTGQDQEIARLALYPDAKDLMLRLADPELWVQVRGARRGTQGTGEIRERIDQTQMKGVWAIRDSKGWEWTLKQLQAAVASRTQYAQQVDPLVTQVSDLVKLAKHSADPAWIDSFVRRLLDQMAEKNGKAKGQTEYDHHYAFSHGQIAQSYENPTIWGTRYNLKGVHLFAHQAIGAAFGGDAFYLTGLDSLLDHERAGSIWDLVIMIDGLVMSVICPPLGAAIFVAQGIHEGLEQLEHAHEQQQIYGGLFNPEEVLSRIEIEVDIFCAKLGIALSVLGAIPEAKAGVDAAITGVKTALREGVLAGAKSGVQKLGRVILEDSLKSMANAMKRGIAKTFVEMMVVQEVMNAVIGKIMNEIVDAHIQELIAEAEREARQ